MVNPTIYTSCIKWLWATAKAKTVNGEVQIQALVDGKKVIVTETSVRRALQLKDVEGIECLPNATIFAELERIGAKTTTWNEFSSTIASAIICLVINQKFNFSKYIFDNMVKNLEGGVKFLMYSSDLTQPMADETKNMESVPIHSNDPLLSGEDKQKLNELLELCTKLPERVLGLENTKTSQATTVEITELKERVKKLEKKKGLRNHRLRRLYKVGRSARVVSSKDEGLGDQEDASKQGREIDEIDQDVEVTLVDENQVRYGDNLMFDIGVLDNEQDMAEKEVDMAKKDVSIADPITTRIAKPKARGVIVQEPSEFTTTTSPSQPSQLPQAKDKGKAKMVVRQEQKEVLKEQLESNKSKKQKIDEHVEVEKDDDQEEAEMKKHMEIVQDDKVTIDYIPLATKSLVIVVYKIVKEGKMG
ncbi:hypothetical protein Tco_1246104 [Tanacetum coccineum]